MVVELAGDLMPILSILMVVVVSVGLIGLIGFLGCISQSFRVVCIIICFTVGFVTICSYTGSWIGQMIYSLSKSIGVL